MDVISVFTGNVSVNVSDLFILFKEGLVNNLIFIYLPFFFFFNLYTVELNIKKGIFVYIYVNIPYFYIYDLLSSNKEILCIDFKIHFCYFNIHFNTNRNNLNTVIKISAKIQVFVDNNYFIFIVKNSNKEENNSVLYSDIRVYDDNYRKIFQRC